MKSRRSGFTLVEMLVTLALMTVIFGVLFSMISGGLRVWQRLQCDVRQEHEIYFALDKIRRGLHSAHPFELISFKGSQDRINFPALVDVEGKKEFETQQEPGQISYYFDKASSSICASEKAFRGMKKRVVETCKPLAQNVDKLKFSYLGYNPQSESFLERGSWSEKLPPVSVKIELEYHDPCSEKKSKKEFLVAIPVGPIR